MTAPSLLDELEEVVRLSERATPGAWHQDTGGDITRDDGTTLFTREKPDGCSSISFANADYVEAAVNFIRAHHAEIAAAVRDAERYRWLRGGDSRLAVCDEDTSYYLEQLDAIVDAATQEGEE